MLTTVAFDCFGTIFDMRNFPRAEIKAYVNHVRSGTFTEFTFGAPWWDLQAFPDVKEGLDMLTAMGLSCFALSNGHRRLITALCKQSGISFAGIWDPLEHQVYKPAVRAYQSFCDWQQRQPAECLMVTANPTFGDVEGSAAIGMASQVIRHGYPNTVLELAESFANRKENCATQNQTGPGGSSYSQL